MKGRSRSSRTRSCPGPRPDDNSVATIVWHIAGNLKSRFTDFQTTDGEKPWRNRDEEFAERTVSREALLEKWEDGWRSLFTALDALADDNLNDVITIRQQPLAIHQALHRSMAHTSYHVGQIVYVAKAFRGPAWRSLSIPRGASASFMKSRGSDATKRHPDLKRCIKSVSCP